MACTNEVQLIGLTNDPVTLSTAQIHGDRTLLITQPERGARPVTPHPGVERSDSHSKRSGGHKTSPPTQ